MYVAHPWWFVLSLWRIQHDRGCYRDVGAGGGGRLKVNPPRRNNVELVTCLDLQCTKYEVGINSYYSD